VEHRATLLCLVSFHRWTSSPTSRPGATFYYCKACGQKMVKTQGRKRQQKRFWIAAAIGLSLVMWFAIINLGRTGHTKIIRSGQIIADRAHETAVDARHKARRTLGAPEDEAL
jgi:hypothetical protein